MPEEVSQRYSRVRSLVRQRIAERFANRVPFLIGGAQFQLLSDTQTEEFLALPGVIPHQEFNPLEEGTLFYHKLFDRYFWLTRYPIGPFSFYERHLIRSTVALHACIDHALGEWGTDDLDPFAYLLSPGDHIVAAFLQSTPGQVVNYQAGWLVQMLEVMRQLVRATFENQPLELAVLVDPQRCLGKSPRGNFSAQLMESKVFQRLSDGHNIAYLTDLQGNLIQLEDLGQRELLATDDTPPLYPTTQIRQALVTRKSGSILLLLNTHGSVQIFWQGEWAFELRHQGWRLLDLGTKYKHLSAHVGPSLARVLFQTAVDLAFHRHGAILLILDDPEKRHQLLMQKDDLRATAPVDRSYAKALLHPLVVDTLVTQMSPELLGNLAALDGAVVVDREARLHSFGAILKNPADELLFSDSAEGSRTKTARLASRYGYAIKVSQDGELAAYHHGQLVWRT